MKHVAGYSKQELNGMLKEPTIQFREVKKLSLKLNITRGKSSADRLDMNVGLLEFPKGFMLGDGANARDYDVLEGVPECKRLSGQLLGLDPDLVMIGGNSSLNLMFDTISFYCLFGTEREKLWSLHGYEGSPIKFLCLAPGYDRYPQTCGELGIQMTPVPLLKDGPDMKMVGTMVREDASIKRVWYVSLHSNPQGVCYSDRMVDRLASMGATTPDFKIFWDNAYGVHHIYKETPPKNILEACEAGRHPNRIYYLFSASRITLSGAGVSLIAPSPDNMKELKGCLSLQTIGHDKPNRLEYVQYSKALKNTRARMKALVEVLRPRFDMVLKHLEEELEGSGLAIWSYPKGGYLISLDTPEGCTERTIELAREAGVTLAGVGAAYPCKKDPKDRNIYIALTYPTPEELKATMDIFILCVKIAGIESVANQRN